MHTKKERFPFPLINRHNDRQAIKANPMKWEDSTDFYSVIRTNNYKSFLNLFRGDLLAQIILKEVILIYGKESKKILN